MQEALKVLHCAHRIVVFGLGPTAHVAAYFAARLRRQGRRQAVIDRGGAQIADQLLDLETGDAILMLAYGQTYAEAEATVMEARRLHLPLVLVTDTPDASIARSAKTVLLVPRGRSGCVALHGTTLVCLEMLLAGLATSGSATALNSLTRLNHLREMARPRIHKSSGTRGSGKIDQDLDGDKRDF